MILFVCTGNTCRSPLAAALARAYGVDAQSAGLSAYPGDPASSQAARVARLYGADLSGHRARQVTREMVDQADAIFVMTPGHRAALCALFPQAASRARVLEPSIPDPYGGGEAVYRQCAESLLEAMKRAGIIRE